MPEINHIKGVRSDLTDFPPVAAHSEAFEDAQSWLVAPWAAVPHGNTQPIETQRDDPETQWLATEGERGIKMQLEGAPEATQSPSSKATKKQPRTTIRSAVFASIAHWTDKSFGVHFHHLAVSRLDCSWCCSACRLNAGFSSEYWSVEKPSLGGSGRRLRFRPASGRGNRP